MRRYAVKVNVTQQVTIMVDALNVQDAADKAQKAAMEFRNSIKAYAIEAKDVDRRAQIVKQEKRRE